MTREEQIIEAGIEYTMQNNPVCIGGDNFYEQAKEFNRNKSFEAGVKWADKHPDINSLWHSPDEMPQYNKRILIHCDEKMEWHPINNTILYENSDYPWKEIVELYNILHWAYATDLVPNFNEKL